MRPTERLIVAKLEEILLAAAKLLQDSGTTKNSVSSSMSAAAALHNQAVLLTMRIIAARLSHPDMAGSARRDREEDCRSIIFASTEFGGIKLTPQMSVAALIDAADNLLEQQQMPFGDLPRVLFLMQLYELSLEYQIDQDNGLRLIHLTQAKKRKGQFYTPLALARRTAETAMNKLLTDGQYLSCAQIMKLKILDPAMGAGIFLLCALDLLEHHCHGLPDQTPTRAELARCVFGVDIDPLACHVACLVLWLYCENSKEPVKRKTLDHFAANLRCADALLSGWSSPEVASEQRDIFHWDQAFSEVFQLKPREDSEKINVLAGFDAVVSNPPWEIVKPNAQEFFSQTSPDFRKLSKQEALAQTRKMLQNQELARQWASETSAFQTKSTFVRAGAANSLFQTQGNSDLNIYKLFLDLGFSILKTGGCLAMLVPSGILVDKGAVPLRRRFLFKGNFFRIESFVNSDRAFNIHPSFAYSIVGVKKVSEGEETQEISVNFGGGRTAQDLGDDGGKDDGKSADDLACFSYKLKDVSVLSPKWLTIFDISHPKDLEVLKKIHQSGTPLCRQSLQASGEEEYKSATKKKKTNGASQDDENWNLTFRREFDMTNDSHLFKAVKDAEAENYRADIYGNWLRGKWQPIERLGEEKIVTNIVPAYAQQYAIKIEDIEEVLLPLYEGRMLGQFDYSQKCHVEGSGRTAIWRTNGKAQAAVLDAAAEYDSSAGAQSSSRAASENFARALIERARSIRPHFLIAPAVKSWHPEAEQPKVGYLAVGSATNARTMLASVLNAVPCGNSVPTLHAAGSLYATLGLAACLNSFVFDYALRMRMTGNNLNFFILQECPLPHRKLIEQSSPITALVASLNLMHPRNAGQWLRLLENPPLGTAPARFSFHYQHVRSILDALIADAYGLSEEEYSWILRDCGRQSPGPKTTRDSSADMKGFWRVDKNSPENIRLPVLALNAYRRLLALGKNEFLRQVSNQQLAFSSSELTDLKTLEANLQNITAIRARV